MTANKEAKKIVIQSIQRVATETAIENSITVFHIESDEIKGRIIGREGRNIRALEAATGIEIVVDDTPEAIVLSGFDPVRREIARLALHQLVQDGRIHPARIEEVVTKVKKQVEDEVVETGKRTVIDLGVHGLHPELIRMIGKMKYRSSYGQNLLQHARETAPHRGGHLLHCKYPVFPYIFRKASYPGLRAAIPVHHQAPYQYHVTKSFALLLGQIRSTTRIRKTCQTKSQRRYRTK